MTLFVFYCPCNRLPQMEQLKTTNLLSRSLGASVVQAQPGLAGSLLSVSQGGNRVWARLSFSSEVTGAEGMHFQAYSGPWRYRTKVPVCLTAVGWGGSQLPESTNFLWLMAPYSSKPWVVGWVLPTLLISMTFLLSYLSNNQINSESQFLQWQNE